MRRLLSFGAPPDDDTGALSYDSGSDSGAGGPDALEEAMVDFGAGERQIIDELMQSARRERPLVPPTDEDLSPAERAAVESAMNLRRVLLQRGVREDWRRNPAETPGEQRMRNVLRPPPTLSDEERHIRDDFEGLVFALVPYTLERETRELLGVN